MEVKKLGNVVCLVITGKFDPEMITAQRTVDYNLVTREESCQIVTRKLDSSLSVFNIAKKIDVFCNKERLQVVGPGEVSDRIPDITRKLLLSSGVEIVDSVGVNAFVDFTFNKREDGIQFGNFFVPLAFWQNYLRDGRVFEFTIAENQRQIYPDSTNSFNIKSIRSRELPNGQRVAAVRLSCNYDFRLDSIDNCVDVINRSLSLFNRFWKEADNIIGRIE